MSAIEVIAPGPATTIQDCGRPGYLRFGVAEGGAVDPFALSEGQALLGNSADAAAFEFGGLGGRFAARGDIWVATSGAEMDLRVQGAARSWRTSFCLRDGEVLEIGAARRGVYGYLHVAGGLDTIRHLGSRSTHRRAGLGAMPAAGDVIATSGGQAEEWAMPAPDYFDQREIRFLWGPQSHLFAEDVRAQFLGAKFTVSSLRDRMGVRIEPDCGPPQSAAGLTTISEAINYGDVQATGDGLPAVMLADRGPTGGYPRIGVISGADVHVLAQMPAGSVFGLRLVDGPEARAALGALHRDRRALASKRLRARRDPAELGDLLGYQLIGGVIRGDEDERG